MENGLKISYGKKSIRNLFLMIILSNSLKPSIHK